jgi:hypothetical protein
MDEHLFNFSIYSSFFCPFLQLGPTYHWLFSLLLSAGNSTIVVGNFITAGVNFTVALGNFSATPLSNFGAG